MLNEPKFASERGFTNFQLPNYKIADKILDFTKA